MLCQASCTMYIWMYNFMEVLLQSSVDVVICTVLRHEFICVVDWCRWAIYMLLSLVIKKLPWLCTSVFPDIVHIIFSHLFWSSFFSLSMKELSSTFPVIFPCWLVSGWSKCAGSSVDRYSCGGVFRHHFSALVIAYISFFKNWLYVFM